MANKKIDSTAPNFEAALKDLETIVNKMGAGELTLEQALKYFEQGISLTRHCQQALKQAEQQVQELIAQDDDNDNPA